MKKTANQAKKDSEKGHSAAKLKRILERIDASIEDATDLGYYVAHVLVHPDAIDKVVKALEKDGYTAVSNATHHIIIGWK